MARTRKRVYVFLFILLTLIVDASVSDAFHISSAAVKQSAGLQAPKQNDLKLGASSLFRTEVETTIPFQGNLGNVLQSKLLILPNEILRGRSQVRNAAVSFTKASVALFKKWWWALPFGLAFVPLYSAAVHRVLPSMPGWWPLTKMDLLLNNPSSNVILTVFLSSNLFYFVSGSYLLIRFNRKTNVLGNRFSKLGNFILTAGVVSTVFHYFQALGSFQVAEALCYLDHAVAISSILYFWHRCGRPGRWATILAGAGLVTLAITDPLDIYPWLHSTWHCLSAGAAVCWAHDGFAKRQRELYLGLEDEECAEDGEQVF